MKRLFQVRDLSTGRVLPQAFSSKEAAKRHRDELEGPRDVEASRRYTVTPGPDHWKYDEGGQQDEQQREERAA